MLGSISAPQVQQRCGTRATVLRLDLTIPDGKPPVVTAKTVIADGLSSQADPSVFLIGPTGLGTGR